MDEKTQMAESMIERVARAISRSQVETERMWQSFLPEASAAIEAMRIPASAMTAAGIKRQVAWDYGEGRGVDEYPHTSEQAVYTAMIDAALAEET
ncbi:hypothetical protein [Shinella sp.]|uniref:hypothetical protein n=1 Tax=Shinella sp. TaxID=1870904 RepID=UPI0028A73A80|nr:hypothetical protein [Shinella sp.]